MEKNKIVRVAQMMTDMNYGGVEMVVMNYYRHIDKSRYQFDFFVLEGSEIPQKNEIEKMGGRIFIVPHYKNLIAYEKAITKYFKREKYKIVHSHMNTLSVFSLFSAWICGIPVRICHNHSTAGKGETKKNTIKYILRPFSRVFPTHLCACSEYAGKWIFGKNSDFKILNNAIKLSDFAYNSEARNKMRAKMNLDGKFVIGHVGRFCYQKNHEFIIDIFNEVCKLNPDSVLLLIGEGEKEPEIRRKVKKLGLSEKVIFAGKKSDVYRYYQAMDLFLLPSRYEGLGMVAIEAQASGLPVIVSDKVPKEVDITGFVKYISLNVPAELWAKKILKLKSGFKRKNTNGIIKKSGYCIEKEAEKLADFYDSLIK